VKRPDLIEFARALRAGTAGRKKPLHQSTVNGYVTTMGLVFKHAVIEWADCAKLTTEMFKEARKHLLKHNIVGKASVRTGARPTKNWLRYGTTTPRRTSAARSASSHAAGHRGFADFGASPRGDIPHHAWRRGLRAEDLLGARLQAPDDEERQRQELCVVAGASGALPPAAKADESPDEKIFKGNPKSASASYTNAKKRSASWIFASTTTAASPAADGFS
jgi:hypothetical protein